MRAGMGFAAAAMLTATLPAQTVDGDFFEQKVRPVLATKCYACHSSKMKVPMGGLVLDTKAGLDHGGAGGPVIAKGKPDESRLVTAMRYTDEHLKMPPGGKLADSVIADFEKWVAGGAPDPRVDAGAAAAAPKRRVVGAEELAKGRQWWAFQPVKPIDAPAVRDAKWAKKKLDAFVLAKLEEAKIAPSPAADDRTLVRRVYLDLAGLKPSYEEVEAYAADRSADKYAKLVDKLLAAPSYGERFGRYWLELARYAEDNVGNITNPPYPHAWRYRDWVIDAMNRDVPYDRFIKLQLAADLMPGTPRTDLPALGLLALGPIEHKDVRLSAEVLGTIFLNDMDERVDAVSRGVLGLSVACARCHDHKFDPIPQRDYYRFESVIASTQRATRPAFDMAPADETRFMWIYQRLFDLHYTANLLEDDPGSKPEQAKTQVAKFRAEIAALTAEMNALAAKYPAVGPYMKTVRYPGEKPPPGEKKEDEQVVRSRRNRAGENAPFLNSVYDAGMWVDSSEPDLTFFTYKPGEPRDLPLYRGGNWNTPGEAAPRGFLAVLARDSGDLTRGSGRLELAERMFSDSAALAARVIVNRAWGWHFGKPLATTPSDFGTQGDKPTHPELLSDLSARFIESGWSMKWLHREMLLSAAYRQASKPRKDTVDVDPDNKLVWRMNPRRLDIEGYRDSILQAAGTLDRKTGGPSDELDESKRRTVYARMSRQRLADLLRLYDVNEPVMHTPARGLTISPTQQLFVMNSPFIQEQAAVMAKAVGSEADGSAKVRALYRKVYGRDPSGKELDLALSYLGGAGLEQYAQALLAANEVIFWP